MQSLCGWSVGAGQVPWGGWQVEEEGGLVCVLLDEVESLTRARSAAVSGSEPADAIRAVNALLTQARQPGDRDMVHPKAVHGSFTVGQ